MIDYLLISRVGIGSFLIPHLGKDKDVGKIYFVCPDTHQTDLAQDMELFRGWEKMIRQPDPFVVLNSHDKESLIVVIDDVSVGPLADHLRKLGYKVIGGSELLDRFENDREFGTQLMGRIMHVPESKKFTSFNDGIGFLKAQEKEARFVFKPDNCDVPKEYTYVASDVADMLDFLSDVRTKWRWEEVFQLQTFIQGTEVDVNKWFTGEDYLPNTLTYYFENKKVLSGDKGVAGGGEIAVEFTREDEGEFNEIFTKLKPFLKRSGYVGQVSLNTMVSDEDKHPYFLESTSRFGYPSMPIDITLIEEGGHTLHQFFQALVNKEKAEMFPRDKVAAVLVVTIPPYPHGEITGAAKGVPLTWDAEYDAYIYPYGMKYDKKLKKTVFSDGTGYGLNVVCVDKTLKGAVATIYDQYLPTIHGKNFQYRTDLGVSAEERIKKLKSIGILR